MENFKEKYKKALEKAKVYHNVYTKDIMEDIFPELAESEDEKVRKELTKHLKELSDWKEDEVIPIKNPSYYRQWATWLEKQGHEPKWCHHKVDLSNCSEEYRKAYYDGWNNCNMQHSQCESEKSDVLKCLINGMKFYYEDNEEATWGTQKFSMKVKDILSWLEKQSEQPTQEIEPFEAEHGKYYYCIKDYFCGGRKQASKGDVIQALRGLPIMGLKDASEYFLPVNFIKCNSAWSEEDEKMFDSVIGDILSADTFLGGKETASYKIDWLKSLKYRVQPRNRWKPSDEQLNNILDVLSFDNCTPKRRELLESLYEQLKKLKEE